MCNVLNQEKTVKKSNKTQAPDDTLELLAIFNELQAALD